VEAIVIGTSAGGVEALSVILPALPADAGIPVFIVLHLPRGRPSVLADIFQDRCALAVCEAEDKEPVEPGTIYFAPPDYHLLLDLAPEGGTQIALSRDEEVHFSRPSIDVLFHSAADLYGESLLGIILTGANEDGAQGLAAVQRAGGITLVQQPASAFVAYMTEAALKRTAADLVLSLDEIADLFRTLGRQPLLRCCGPHCR